MLCYKIKTSSFPQQYKAVCKQANYLLVFLIPILLTVIINLLIQYRLYTVGKSILETIALIVLAGFLLICLVRFTLDKNIFSMWAGCLLLALFIREIHPPGSSAGIYLVVFALFYVAQSNYHKCSNYFQDKRLINLIAMGFFTYFISITIDQRFWKFIPGEELAHVPLEESLEMVGHLFIGFGLAFASNKIQYSNRLKTRTLAKKLDERH